MSKIFLDEIVILYQMVLALTEKETTILYTTFLLTYEDYCKVEDGRFYVSFDEFMEFYPYS